MSIYYIVYVDYSHLCRISFGGGGHRQGNALNQLPVGGGSAQDERALRLSLLTRQQNESRRPRR